MGDYGLKHDLSSAVNPVASLARRCHCRGVGWGSSDHGKLDGAAWAGSQCRSAATPTGRPQQCVGSVGDTTESVADGFPDGGTRRQRSGLRHILRPEHDHPHFVVVIVSDISDEPIGNDRRDAGNDDCASRVADSAAWRWTVCRRNHRVLRMDCGLCSCERRSRRDRLRGSPRYQLHGGSGSQGSCSLLGGGDGTRLGNPIPV